jgi:hypothetical protein
MYTVKIIDKKTVPAQTTLEGQLVDKTNITNYWTYLKGIGDPND